jgi:hypothetical protein
MRGYLWSWRDLDDSLATRRWLDWLDWLENQNLAMIGLAEAAQTI